MVSKLNFRIYEKKANRSAAFRSMNFDIVAGCEIRVARENKPETRIT